MWAGGDVRAELYTLLRLASEGELGWTREAPDRLAAHAPDGSLHALVQLARAAAPLTIDDLASSAGEVLRRMLGTAGAVRCTVASLGPTAPELREGWARAGATRQQLVWRLGDHGFLPAEAAQLFERVALVEEDPAALAANARAALAEAVGGAPDGPLALVLYWLGRATPATVLSRAALAGRLVAARRYLETRAAGSWPALERLDETPALGADERRALVEEFRRGAPTRFAHIAADADQRRPGALERLDAAFGARSVVVVHGGSGMGKRALACRWLRERVPEALRFRGRTPLDGRLAAALAVELGALAAALEVPITIYLDDPATRWPDAVARLTEAPGLRVLVVLDEPAWRQARAFGPRLALAPVELGLDDEAARLAPGAAGATLLERVHLATWGRTLAERLGDPTEAPPALERRAVAARFGARLVCAEPLHGVVGAAVGSAGTWPAIAAETLPSVEEADLERFLLGAFAAADGGPAADPIVAALAPLQPRSWLGVGAVVRALLWLGLRRYVDEHAALIAETRARLGDAWPLILDANVAGLAGPGADWLDGPGLSEEARALIHALRARQQPPTRAREPLRRWLEARTDAPQPPASAADWRAVAETRFWLRALGLVVPPLEQLDPAALEGAAAMLSVDELVELLLGLDEAAEGWRAQQRSAVEERLAGESATLAVEDDGQTARAHFLARPAAADALRDEAWHQILLLRGLWPRRAHYAAQGYGHRAAHAAPQADPSDQVAPVEKLAPPWASELNLRFIQLAEHPLRPTDWPAYAVEVATLRQIALARLQQLVKALASYFRKEKGVVLPGTLIEVGAWEQAAQVMSRPPRLPRTAVDAWGLVAEPVARAQPEELRRLERTPRLLALEPLEPLLASAATLWAALGSFFRHSGMVLAVNSLSKSRPAEVVRKIGAEVGFRPEARGSSVESLGQALRALPRFQAAWRGTGGATGRGAELELLERRERDTLEQAFALWERFALHPVQTLSDPLRIASEGVGEALAAARAGLRRHLRKLSHQGVASDVLRPLGWQGEPAQWIAIDVQRPTELYAAYLAVHQALGAALQEIGASEAQRHAFAAAARRIVVVGRVRGRSLAQAGWVIPVEPEAEPAAGALWLHHLNRAASDEDWRAAGMSTWDAPRLRVADELQGEVRRLHDALAQLADLGRLPTERRSGLVEARVAAGAAELTAQVQRVSSRVLAVLGALEAVPASERAGRAALVAAVQRLASFYQGSVAPLISAEATTPTLASLAQAAETLESSLADLEVFRLLWASDTLGIALAPA